jgi:hypothetical protein
MTMAKKKGTQIEGDQTLPLTELQVENILRLRAFKLTMDKDGAVIIEANNQQGKTSALKSLEILLAGTNKTPPEPIYGDAKTGKIVGKFGDITLRKVFTRGKGYKLTVESDAISYSKPQTLLDTLLKRISLDPGEFAGMDDKRRFDTIARVMQVDMVAMEAKRKRIYDERRDANRDLKRLKTEYEGMPYHEDAPEAPVDVTDLMAKLEEDRQHNQKGEKLDSAYSQASAYADECKEGIEAAKKALADAESELGIATREKAAAKAALVNFDPKDTADLELTIANASTINAQITDNERRQEARKKYMTAEEQATALNDQLEEIERLKKEKLQEAQERLPVPGLSLGEDTVLYKGKPLSQAGSSATALVSAAIAMALNKDSRIKLLLIDDAEKFDPPTTRKVLEMAHNNGFQVIMARVGDGEKATVVIEDGQIKE